MWLIEGESGNGFNKKFCYRVNEMIQNRKCKEKEKRKAYIEILDINIFLFLIYYLKQKKFFVIIIKFRIPFIQLVSQSKSSVQKDNSNHIFSMRNDNQSNKDIDNDLQAVYDYFDKKNSPQVNIDDHQLAPTKHYRMEYRKFVNFQKNHIFKATRDDLIDQRPLKVHQIRKLIRLIGYIYAKHNSAALLKEDIKGIWSIISFIFPQRTGLFMSQFFSMIIAQKLTLDMYPDYDTKRQLTIVLSNTKDQRWFNDKEFLQNIDTLIKQAKTSQQNQKDTLLMEYNKVIGVLVQNDQFRKNMDSLIQAMKGFGVLAEVHYLSVEMQEWRMVLDNSPMEPDYPLSEPDTLVADICQEFEEKEYNFIKRKLSDHHEEYQEQTQTNIHLRTASSRKLNNNKEQKEEDQTMKFKRRINFDAKIHNENTVNQFSFEDKSSDQQTKPYKRLKKQRPTHKNYIQKRIDNYRQIDTKLIKRVQIKKQIKSQAKPKAQKLRIQNIFIQKQIKKHTFIDSSLTTGTRQKRDLQGQKQVKNQKNSSRQKNNRPQSMNWNNRFVEDDSVNNLISISSQKIHDDDQGYSNRSLSQNKRKRSSVKKNNQNNQQRKQKASPKAAKQVKPKRTDYRKKQIHTLNRYMDSSEEQNQERLGHSKGKPNQSIEQNKVKSIEKRQRGNMFGAQINKRQEGKKEKALKRLKKQGSPQDMNENSNQFTQLQSHNDSQFLLNNEQALSSSQQLQGNNQSKNQGKRQSTRAFLQTQTNQHKYSHLLYDIEQLKQKKAKKPNPQRTLDQYVTNHQTNPNSHNFQPLDRLLIRKLSLLEFEQTQQAQSRMMIIQGDQMNPYMKMRRQVNEYLVVEAEKMQFTLNEYMNYIASFQTHQEVMKEIKKITHQYLAKTFDNNLGPLAKKISKKFTHEQQSLKLILIARKIIAMYILAKKQSLFQNNQNLSKIFSQYSLTYINPLLNHYIYQILIENYAQIINSLFTSEGDQDFELLHKASLPFLMLLHDVKQLADDQNYAILPDFCKTLYEEIYQVINHQSAIIMCDIISAINPDTPFSKTINEKVQSLLKSQSHHSNIYLPRPTNKFIQKHLRIQLHPLSFMFASFAAYTHFEMNLYEKIQLIFTTMHPEISIKQINQLRPFKMSEKNKKGEKEHMIQTVEYMIQGICSLKNQDKGIGQIYNFSKIINRIFQTMNFQMQSSWAKFSLESKIISIILRNLKQVCRSTGPSIPMIGQNNRKSQQNQHKQKTLQTMKQCLRNSLTCYISQQCKQPVNFSKLLNIITKQQLTQLTLQSTFSQQSYINVDLNLEMIAIFMKFTQFRENNLLNKPQVLKIIQKILNDIKENKVFMFGGKNRSPELMKKMFQLLIIGYKCQIYEKNNIWKVNDDVLPTLKMKKDGSIPKPQLQLSRNQTYVDYLSYVDKKDLAHQYWSMIKEMIKTVMKKYNSNISQLGHMSSVHELQIQKLKTYSSLLQYMLNQVTENVSDSKLLDLQYFYQNCKEDNCLSYSIRHALVNLVSLFAEFDFFVQLNTDQDLISSSIHKLFNPVKMAQNLTKIAFINKEKQINEQLYDDEDDRADDIMALSFQRDQQKPAIIYKWILVVCTKLKHQDLPQKIKSLINSHQASGTWAIISVIQYLKRLLITNNLTQNSHNQRQRAILARVPFVFQYIKKYEYLTFPLGSSLGVNNQRQIKQTQVQDLECMFEFMVYFCKFLLPLLNVKKCPQLVIVTEQFLKKMVQESNVHRVNLLNIVGTIILKKMVSSTKVKQFNLSQVLNKTIQISKQQKTRLQIDDFLIVMQLWCKIYQNTHNVDLSSSIVYNLNDVNSLLYLIFKSVMEKKKNNQKQIYQRPMIYTLMDTCAQVFKTSYFRLNQPKVGTYNSLMIGLVEMLYHYMKQLSSYANGLEEKKQKQGNRQIPRFEQSKVKTLVCQQTLAITYAKIFNTVIQWQLLLTSGIQKTKLQYEILIYKDLNQLFTKSKSLVESIIDTKIVSEDSDLTKDSSNTYPQSKVSKLHQSIKLLEECIVSLNLLEANVYDIKVNIPQWIFTYVLKKIVQSEIKNYQPSNVQYKAPYLQQNNRVQKQLKPITLLFKIFDSLSLLNSSFLLKKIVTSCIKFLPYDNRLNQRHQYGAKPIGNQQKIDFEQYELKVHLTGKEKIPNYRERLFMTILKVVKYSTKHRQTIQNIIWESQESIEKFIQKVNYEKQSLRGQINKVLPNQANKYITQRDNEQSLPQSYQEMISKWLIGYHSHFSLIKAMIDSRVEKIIKLGQSSVLKPQNQMKLSFLKQAIQKALAITQKLNSSCEQALDQTHKYDQYLQTWFREKLTIVNDIIKNKNKKQTRTRSHEQNPLLNSAKSNNSISVSQNLDIYMIQDPIKRESTKMQIEE